MQKIAVAFLFSWIPDSIYFLKEDEEQTYFALSEYGKK